jgi:hypothetical protein
MTNSNHNIYNTQNELLLKKLVEYYKEDDKIDIILPIINGTSTLSIRIIDWFVTNYSKKYYTLYDIPIDRIVNGEKKIIYKRFKVYNDYKLKLKAYSKKRFDPFCRWDRIHIPYKGSTFIQTTIGQLNFFRWALENNIIEYISDHFKHIEQDMNTRNSNAKKNKTLKNISNIDDNQFNIKNNNNQSLNSNCSEDSNGSLNQSRKKREELSISAAKSIKKENVEIVVKFN